jgi:hypothetical protein
MTELPESLQKRYREEINKLTDRGRRWLIFLCYLIG